MGQIEGIAQVAISVTDVARATAFYRDTLGLKLLFSPSPQMVFFDLGGTRLLVSNQGGTPGASGTFLYLRTPDIRAMHAKVARAGASSVEEPHIVAKMPGREIWLAAFKDPDGNVLHMMSEVAAGPAQG